MIRSFFVTLLLLGAAYHPAHARAQPADSLMTAGAALYEQQRYNAALESFRAALAEHGPAGAIYFNLGTAYYRAGELGQAIRYLEKAARLMPGNQRVEQNLAVARESIVEPIPQMPRPFWQRWWNALIALVGARGLFLIGLAAYIPVVLLIGYGAWTGRGNQPRRLAIRSLGLVAVLAMAVGLWASWHEISSQEVVILSTDTALYADPSTNSTATRNIPVGTVVSVTEDLNEWQQVTLPNGAAGWVEKSAVGEI